MGGLNEGGGHRRIEEVDRVRDEVHVVYFDVVKLLPGRKASPQAAGALGGDVDDRPGTNRSSCPGKPGGDAETQTQREKRLVGPWLAIERGKCPFRNDPF